MLEARIRQLPEAEQQLLQRWLLQPESFKVRQSLLAEIANLQVEAANVVIRNAEALVMQAGLDAVAQRAITRAARLQTFLDVLTEITSSDYAFKAGEVHITDK